MYTILFVPDRMGFSTRLGMSIAFLDLSAWLQNKIILVSYSWKLGPQCVRMVL